MRGIDNDVIGDVGIQCHFVVLGRGVDINSAGVVAQVVVGDRQQFGVLDKEVDDADSGVI